MATTLGRWTHVVTVICIIMGLITTTIREAEGRDCYLCVYRNATEGGMVSGLEQCSDHFHYQNVMKARCDTGYCKKEVIWNGNDYSVTRNCEESCDQSQLVTTDTSHYTYCCNEHLCNHGNIVKPSHGSWLRLSLTACLMMAIVQVSNWWLTI